MGVIDRIVLSIYTLALAGFSGTMILLAAFPDLLKLQSWIEDMRTANGRWVTGLIGTVFFAVSIRLIFFAVKRQGGGPPVVHETAMGDVRISLDAVENLVRKVARSIKGVREIRAVITHGKDGLHAHLTGTISPEVSIPAVSEEIQTTVRQYVKRVVGVEIADIRLEVDNIASDGRRARLD